MRLEDVTALDDPRLAPYANLRDRQLRASGELSLVEGRLGVRCLLTQSSFVPHSFFVTPATLDALADVLGKLPPDTPVFRGSRDLLCEVAGYNLHRGCLAAVFRGSPMTPGAVLDVCAREGRPLLVLEELGNPENVGNVFRNAVAFGAGGVWMTGGCADPLYRQATRIAIGGSLRVPFARPAFAVGEPIGERLRGAGFTSVALTPDGAAEPIGSTPVSGPRIALLLGSEGDGLSDGLLASADRRVRIPLMPDVDSLNVATASGIALQHLFAGRSA